MISFCFKYIVKEYKNAHFGFVLIFLTHIVYAIGTRQPRGRHRQPMICMAELVFNVALLWLYLVSKYHDSITEQSSKCFETSLKTVDFVL